MKGLTNTNSTSGTVEVGVMVLAMAAELDISALDLARRLGCRSVEELVQKLREERS